MMSREKKIIVIMVCTIWAISLVHAETSFITDIKNGETKKIVTMGTSLTAGTTGWVSQLEAWAKSLAPDPANVVVVNVAVGGVASNHGISTQLPNAKLQNPDVVFIEFAVNDAITASGLSIQDCTDNLNYIINDLEAHNPDIEVVLMTMNNVINEHLTARPLIADYYQVYRDVAATRGLTLIDHYPNWLVLYNADPVTWLGYVPDGIHPNTAGAINIIQPEIERVFDPIAPIAIINGSFENDPIAWLTLFADLDMDGWTDNGVGTLWNEDGLNTYGFPDFDASEGVQMITLQEISGTLTVLSQDLATVVGKQYKLTFDQTILCANGSSLTLLSLQLSATGNAAEVYSMIPDAPCSACSTLYAMPYVTQAYVFTAISDVTTITFENLIWDAGGNRIAIDNVAVQDYNCLPLPADLTGDCIVNLYDLAILAADWLQCNLYPQSLCP